MLISRSYIQLTHPSNALALPFTHSSLQLTERCDASMCTCVRVCVYVYVYVGSSGGGGDVNGFISQFI